MKTFYEFIQTYRHSTSAPDEARLAEWVCTTNDFPKFSYDFHEISDFLEMYSPFPEALHIFDTCWQCYEMKYVN